MLKKITERQVVDNTFGLRLKLNKKVLTNVRTFLLGTLLLEYFLI